MCMENLCKGSDLGHGGRLQRAISDHAEYDRPWPAKDLKLYDLLETSYNSYPFSTTSIKEPLKIILPPQIAQLSD